LTGMTRKITREWRPPQRARSAAPMWASRAYHGGHRHSGEMVSQHHPMQRAWLCQSDSSLSARSSSVGLDEPKTASKPFPMQAVLDNMFRASSLRGRLTQSLNHAKYSSTFMRSEGGAVSTSRLQQARRARTGHGESDALDARREESAGLSMPVRAQHRGWPQPGL
jgi:hypothetical protein